LVVRMLTHWCRHMLLTKLQLVRLTD
jgi:hypothetical protein